MHGNAHVDVEEAEELGVVVEGHTYYRDGAARTTGWRRKSMLMEEWHRQGKKAILLHWYVWQAVK